MTELRKAQHIQTSGRTEYLTPRHIINALGPFDLDPCASIVRPWPTAARHYTIEDDGLKQPWEGFVWLNPPYGKQESRWVQILADHKGGGIALLSAQKTETQLWQRVIWPGADGFLFLNKRLRFCNTDGSPMPGTFGGSVLVAFGTSATDRLCNSILGGAYVERSYRPQLPARIAYHEKRIDICESTSEPVTQTRLPGLE